MMPIILPVFLLLLLLLPKVRLEKVFEITIIFPCVVVVVDDVVVVVYVVVVVVDDDDDDGVAVFVAAGKGLH